MAFLALSGLFHLQAWTAWIRRKPVGQVHLVSRKLFALE